MIFYCFVGVDLIFNIFFNKWFMWNCIYDLNWDIICLLKFNFNVYLDLVIDELDEIDLLECFENFD